MTDELCPTISSALNAACRGIVKCILSAAEKAGYRTVDGFARKVAIVLDVYSLVA
jgi:hypothetical protein